MGQWNNKDKQKCSTQRDDREREREMRYRE